jgi:hypothetical protein
MLANCFTKPLLKPAVLKQCPAMGLELGMASEMAAIRSEVVTGMLSELEKASGMPSESKLIGLVSSEEIHVV